MKSTTVAIKQKNIPPTIIRPDLNIEKWPGIWTPSQSRSKPKLKVLERKKILDDGSITLSRVEINPSLKYGNLTTEDQKVWYGLLELWRQAGKPQTLIFSLSQLAKILRRAWGSETLEGLKKSLMRLNISALSWVNSYYDSKTKQTLEMVDSFHIIADLHLVHVSEKHKINSEQCSCRFSDLLYQNLLNNYTKPTFFDVVLQFKSGIAQLLYKYLELVMHDKTSYERNSKELFFEDLKLEAEEYKKPSIRKRALLVALPELNECLIPSGTLLVSLAQNKDKTDWKVVVKKSLHNKSVEKGEKPSTQSDPPFPKIETSFTKVADCLSKPITTTGNLAEEVVLFFFEQFGLRRDKPSKKEIEHAKKLLMAHQLNFQQAQYIIDFAKGAAKQDGYKPKNFGGILQYVDAALEEQKQIKSREWKSIIKTCEACKESGGFLYVTYPNGHTAAMRCPHDAEKIKLLVKQEGFKVGQ
jgi:hypothetical protein